MKDATEQQRTIIEHDTGAMLVLAGAGSGKTTTVSARGAGLVLRRVCEPQDHLMLTFSRKAAREMRIRCHEFLTESAYAVPASKLPVETYHAFGYRLLRDHPGMAGRREGVTLQDDADRKRMIKGICQSMNLDYKHNRGRIEGWYQAYSLAKNYGLYALDAANEDRLRSVLQSSSAVQPRDVPTAMRFVYEYEKRLALTNVFDFDDLCLWAARGLRDNPDLAADLADRFPIITIDEAQDTNLVQYEMVHAIARAHGNLTLVGDDDQSIYGWRGARLSNMKRFIRDYEPVKARLERNFRSTPAIVRAAAAHIGFNERRLDKKPFAQGAEGDRPALGVYATGYDMADGIADQILAALDRGSPAHEIAVLYRTNRMARVLESSLRSRGVPYHIVGGHSLYDATEVKVAIAGARLLLNNGDEQAMRQMLPHIPGLGAKGLDRLLTTAEDHPSGRLNIFGAGALMGGRMLEYTTWLDQRLNTLKSWGPTCAGAWVLADEGLGYERRLNERAHSSEDAAQEAARRIANLHALDRATENAQVYHGAVDPSARLDERFAVLLEAQLSDPDTSEGEPRSAVTLSTAHRAKGLEWSIVHIAGYSDGLMPIVQRDENADPQAHLSEERRLSYVAITRARHTCALHHAEQMRFPGDPEPSFYQPSPFLDELGLAVPDNVPAPANRPGFAPSM